MLIDTGAGVGANVIGLVLPADEILVVTTPEPTAITDAYGMIKSVVSHGPSGKIKLIVNRVPDAGEAKLVADRLISISNQFLKARIENLGFILKNPLFKSQFAASALTLCSIRPQNQAHASSTLLPAL
jgi:flagellar biosynthesis protein FlhG